MKKSPNHCLVAVFLTLLAEAFLASDCRGITLDEISLMLRTGFSSETILREGVVNGRVYGTFDAEREKEFKDLKASPALIDALKSGKYAPSDAETRRFNSQQAVDAEGKREAALRRDREQAEQMKIAQRTAQSYAANQQRVAAEAEANLNQRVINVLSTPLTEFIEMSTTVRGDRIDAKAAERRQLYQQLISNETFVRETLR
jgi:hypothetical protein